MTISDVRKQINADPSNWPVYVMDFVDEFRRTRHKAMIAMPFARAGDKIDALLASIVETLCDELGIEVPAWLEKIPALGEPYFVSGIESLRAIAIVESPLRFRLRKIFVLENFLSRA